MNPACPEVVPVPQVICLFEPLDLQLIVALLLRHLDSSVRDHAIDLGSGLKCSFEVNHHVFVLLHGVPRDHPALVLFALLLDVLHFADHFVRYVWLFDSLSDFLVDPSLSFAVRKHSSFLIFIFPADG